jgi:toxin ParE1/3/4
VARLIWTEEALLWLRDIHEHIAADDPSAAERTVEAIYARAQDLLAFPQLGYRYAAARQDVRILLYKHYRIAYFEDPAGDVVIIGVFHGALDLDRYVI